MTRTTGTPATSKGIFVPFESFPGRAISVKCDDLPRFDRIEDVHTYMRDNWTKLQTRFLAWDEIFEKWAQDEFETGVGTLRILL